MAQLAPIQLQDGTMIYIEASDDLGPLTSGELAPKTEPQRGGEAGGSEKGFNWSSSHQTAPRLASTQRMSDLESTIRSYTRYTLDAFQGIGNANIDKVTLEFGVKVSGEAGIPYITKGSAEGNLKITVECSLGEQDKQDYRDQSDYQSR